MKKTVITYGLIAGCISAAMMLLSVFVSNHLDFDKGELVGYGSMLLASIVIYLGMAAYRDNVGGGQISYGRALSVGLLITAISAACYTITWACLYHTVFPDFMEKYAACMISKALKRGASPAELAKVTEQMKHYRDMYKNPVTMLLLTFMEPLPVGIPVSLIAALIVRMKKRSA